jgi:predicted O-methyltransferase YrrM
MKYSEFIQTDYYSSLPYGELTAQDETALFEESKDKQFAVELGTFLGRSALIIGHNAKAVVTVDIYDDIGIIKDEKNRVHYEVLSQKNPHNHEDIRKILMGYPNILPLKAFDVWAAGYFKNVDFLFIDSDHSYEGVKNAFNSWFPCIQVGGVILLHDSKKIEQAPHLEVYKFVNELEREPRVKLLKAMGSITVWRKENLV